MAQNSIQKLISNFSNKLKQKTWYGLFNTSDFDYIDYEKRGGFDLYKLSLYLNKAINKRAEKVGETKFLVKDLKGTVIQDVGGETEWIYKLFNRPNKLMSGKQFFSTLQKNKDLLGKAYVFCVYESTIPELFGNDTGKKTSKVTEMHLLDPRSITEVFDKETNTITQYKYQTKSEGIKTYEATQIIRIVRIDPANPLGSETLIEAGKRVISTGIQLDDYQSNVLKNGGSVKGILKFKDQTLTQEEVETQKDRYKEQYAGAKKSGIPMFLGGNVDYQQTGLSPDELGYLSSKNCNLNDICIMTGVPKSILGNFDEIKYDNAQASYRIFLQETITPEVKEIVEAFNWTIIPDKYNLSFEEIVPEDKAETKLILEAGSNAYCMTQNEKRRLLGLEDVKGGDVILVPFSLMPMGSDYNAPAEEKAFNKKAFKPIIKEEVRNDYAEAQLKYIDQRSKQLEAGVIDFANKQEKRIFKVLSLGKAMKKGVKVELDGIYDEEVALAVKFITPYLEELITDAGNGALDLLGISKPLTMTETMKKVMAQKAKFYAKTTTNTTFERLENTLSAGMEANETIVQLTERVQGVFTEYKTYRAELIARTESTTANNEGLIEAYKQSGVATGKEWIAVMDDRTREEHAMLNGEIVGLNENFSNGLSYPQEPNCRCLIGPAMDEE
jgi:HK97 family phage portal protein